MRIWEGQTHTRRLEGMEDLDEEWLLSMLV